MRRVTALKVADTLALVEVWLEYGRPRKRPNGDRPEALNEWGQPVSPTRTPVWSLGKVSLPAAFQVSTKEQGYSRYVRQLAEDAFVQAAEKHGWSFGIHEVRDIDYYEDDTRQLMRYARAARRELEKTYGL